MIWEINSDSKTFKMVFRFLGILHHNNRCDWWSNNINNLCNFPWNILRQVSHLFFQDFKIGLLTLHLCYKCKWLCYNFEVFNFRYQEVVEWKRLLTPPHIFFLLFLPTHHIFYLFIFSIPQPHQDLKLNIVFHLKSSGGADWRLKLKMCGGRSGKK